MTLSVGLGSAPCGSVEVLETTYRIGKFIQSHVTDEPEDESGKPWSNYSGLFRTGPNPFYNQTKKGLVLKCHCGIPSEIHTPYGCWSILGSASGDYGRVFEVIKEALSLVLLNAGWFESSWAITKWEKMKVEMPEYKKHGEYISREKEREVWKSFATQHLDLSQ